MQQIVVKGGAGALVQMFMQGDVPRLGTGIQRAVKMSFRDRPMEHQTHDEVKRRIAKCIEMAKVLRGDFKWGVQRIIDHLPQFLRDDLDGKSWRPGEARTLWTPGDGA